MGGKLGAFLLWVLAVILVWLALGPLVREVVVNGFTWLHMDNAARYVDSA